MNKDMKTDQRGVLIRTLMNDENIFICGPQFGENHLRVYAYGGLLCQIPTTPKAGLILFNPDYIRYCADARDENLLTDAFDIRRKDKAILKKDESKYYFGSNCPQGAERYTKLGDKENLGAILRMLKKRFTQKKKGADTDGEKERGQQTTIARNHRDFQKNNGVVVCDFESCIPKKMYVLGSPNGEEKLARFDLMALKLPEADGKAILYMIEYKCNKVACEQKSSGLKRHAEDMTVCASIGGSYVRELLRRFRTMCESGLLQNLPEGLDAVLDALERDTMRVDIRKCFLFTEGTGLCRKTVAEICKSKTCIPEQEKRKDFYYLFCEDPKKVDLSGMRLWDEFLTLL